MKIIPILVATNIIIFIVQLAVNGFTEMFILNSATVLQTPWTLITSMFMHAGVEHLLFNMFALFIFGIILETIIGSRKLLVVYFSSGIVAGIASIFFYTSVLGASGAIYGLMACLAVLRPKLIVWTYGVPMPMVVALIFWALLDLGGVFYPSNIANMAHLAGMGTGIIAGILLRTPSIKKEDKNKIDENKIDKWEDKYMKIYYSIQNL